jgi:hypothetical protein
MMHREVKQLTQALKVCTLKDRLTVGLGKQWVWESGLLLSTEPSQIPFQVQPLASDPPQSHPCSVLFIPCFCWWALDGTFVNDQLRQSPLTQIGPLPKYRDQQALVEHQSLRTDDAVSCSPTTESSFHRPCHLLRTLGPVSDQLISTVLFSPEQSQARCSKRSMSGLWMLASRSSAETYYERSWRKCCEFELVTSGDMCGGWCW